MEKQNFDFHVNTTQKNVQGSSASEPRDVLVGSIDQMLPPSLPSRYEILEKIGTGGMGAVYKVYNKDLGRIEALKVILRAEKNPEYFLSEARIIAQLKHPNIVEIYNLGIPPAYYYTMEYLPGKSLKEIDKPIHDNFSWLAKIFYKIAVALQYAHRQSIIHRDIKSSNIILVGDEPKLVDFGLAQIRGKCDRQEYGTEFYMSPEQTNGDSLDPRTDIYSLGVTLYELLAGVFPFPKGLEDILSYHAAKNPKNFNPSIPDSLAKICLKCLEKNPANRYATAKELAEALQDFLTSVEKNPQKPGKLSNVTAIKGENMMGGYHEVNVNRGEYKMESSILIDVKHIGEGAKIKEEIRLKEAKNVTALETETLDGANIDICIKAKKVNGLNGLEIKRL